MLFVLLSSNSIAQNSSNTLIAADSITALSADTALTAEKASVAEKAENGTVFSEVGQKVQEKPMEVLNVISFSKIFWAIVLLIIGYYFIKLVIKLLTIFSERSSRLRIAFKGVIPVVRITVWCILIFAIIKGIFDPPIETVVAMTASISIAVGFAAQDLLKNVFGGIALLLDRPFLVGDKIEIGKYYGEVTEIGLRATRLITPDDSLVSVPNSELVNTAVSNSNSGELNCQVVAEIYLPIDIDTNKVRSIAIEAAKVSKYVYLDKPIVALFFNEVKQRRSYFKMRLKAYVLDIRYEFQFKSDMTEIVIRELLKEGILNSEDLF